MYSIEFYHQSLPAKHYSINHGLQVNDISAEKITGSDYFAKEPKRLDFTLLIDDWLTEYILSDKYELERMISQFRIKLYKENEVLFTGIIDMSHVSYDERTEAVSFIAYDYLKLLSMYSNLNLSANDITKKPENIFTDFIDRLNERLNFGITFKTPISYKPLNILQSNLTIFNVEWQEPILKMQEFISDAFSSWTLKFHVGFTSLSNANVKPFFMVYLQANKYVKKDNKYSAMVYGRMYYRSNVFCFTQINNIQANLNYMSMAYDDRVSLLNELKIMRTASLFFHDNNLNTLITNNSSGSRCFINSDFHFNFDGNQLVPVLNTPLPVNPPKTFPIYYTGNIVPLEFTFQGWHSIIFNGGRIGPLIGDHRTFTKLLNALKTALILHNLTINCDNLGCLSLVNKNDFTVNNPLSINTADIIEYKKQRKNRDQIDNSVFDSLIGDLAALKTEISNYYDKFLTELWEITLTLMASDKYNALKLFDDIVVENSNCKIASIKPDIRNETIEIVAWEKKQ